MTLSRRHDPFSGHRRVTPAVAPAAEPSVPQGPREPSQPVQEAKPTTKRRAPVRRRRPQR